MKTLCILLLLLNSIVHLDCFIWGKQSVAVEGMLTCGNEPAVGIKAKLYHKFLLFNCKLAKGVTDKNGRFSLNGSAYVLRQMKPRVEFYHKCNYKGLCYRKFGVTIPEIFITDGGTPMRTFNVGIIPLDRRIIGESIGCLT